MPVTELGSAPVPGPEDDDHVRGADGAPLVIEYADFECPFCAALHERLAGLPVRIVFRHFPVRSSHPRAWAAACAAEAAGLQGRFWEMHDSLFADQGRLEDPHLWDRARARSDSISSVSTPTAAARRCSRACAATFAPACAAGS